MTLKTMLKNAEQKYNFCKNRREKYFISLNLILWLLDQ